MAQDAPGVFGPGPYLNANSDLGQLKLRPKGSTKGVTLGDVVGTLPSMYLGEVATRARVPAVLGTIINPAATEAQSMSVHYMRQGVSSFQIVVPFFYVVPGAGERAIPGTTTWQAWIVYKGVRTAVSWG